MYSRSSREEIVAKEDFLCLWLDASLYIFSLQHSASLHIFSFMASGLLCFMQQGRRPVYDLGTVVYCKEDALVHRSVYWCLKEARKVSSCLHGVTAVFRLTSLSADSGTMSPTTQLVIRTMCRSPSRELPGVLLIGFVHVPRCRNL